MRRRIAILLLVAPLVVFIALVASAQKGKGKGKGKGDEKKADTEQPADAGGASAEGGAKAAEEEEAPPPKVDYGDGGVRPSPLNPRDDELPDGAAPTPPADYDKLLGDIAALRGRVSALTTTLFSSKLKVSVELDGDDARLQSLVITLDDGVVYRAPKQFTAEDPKVVYEHAVAPGHHVVGVEIERVDARGKQYSTWQASKFSVVVPESETLEAELLLEDDSDMAEDFPDDQEGEYDLRVRLNARVAD